MNIDFISTINECFKNILYIIYMYTFSITAGGESLMYLRMRIGQPIGSKIKRDEMINTYGEANVKPDYWFIITQSRADFIFDFFHNISDKFRIYGVLDVMAIELGGLELVREGRDAIGKLNKDALKIMDKLTLKTGCFNHQGRQSGLKCAGADETF